MIRAWPGDECKHFGLSANSHFGYCMIDLHISIDYVHYFAENSRYDSYG